MFSLCEIYNNRRYLNNYYLNVAANLRTNIAETAVEPDTDLTLDVIADKPDSKNYNWF